MSIAELTRIVRIVAIALLSFGIAYLIAHYARQRVERAAKKEIAINDNTLVGMKAIAVSELRPNTVGEIRSIFSPEKESALALAGDDFTDTAPETEDDLTYKTYPAISEQFISKGRTVRVTGGDNELYRVRAAADTFPDKK